MIYILLTWLLAPIWWPISQFCKWRCPQPQRILIAEIAGIGDVVCSTAVFSAVRSRYPDAHIALMVDDIAADLARAIPAVNQVIAFRAANQRGLRGRLALMRQFMGFDTFVCLIPSAAQLTAACWAALPRRYSVLPDVAVRSYAWLLPLMTQTTAHQSGSNFVCTQLKLLATLGIQGNPVNRELPVSEAAKAEAALLINNHHDWIGLAIGSGQGIKAIQPEVLKEVIRGLLSNPGRGVVLIGGKKEQALAKTFIDDIAPNVRCINAVGRLSLDKLPGMLQKLSVFIGVDSGVTYMADALNVPLVYLPGPASPADQGPLRAPRITLQKTLDCAPCSRVFVTPNQCVANNHACIDSFSASEILEAVDTLLKGALNGAD
ncbi:glycosyltransferase family 9 protein [Fluviibacter phosphoraccumulans]|uniref:Glycosyl transferase family 9 n=1 Tax=Fluviibacter phosphoraccumulans TaxID=1751046 RepID=A0A7R6QZI0_9RHOO|nr:glycosyltransferase family 9 protein [Fluviibacter phosphoraccumulans]BBU68055.1 glycosyl transferase family 9 [Fluviibacter phosphoraccumulans]BBU70405.1 glycosyl transferase family 9 [Fluviibacter phosphoraccumulans]